MFNIKRKIFTSSLLLMLLLSGIQHSYAEPFDMRQASLIERLLITQQPKIDSGALSQTEARCIAENSILKLKQDAPRFVQLAEKQFTQSAFNLLDESDSEYLFEQYLGELSYIALRCESPDQSDPK